MTFLQIVFGWPGILAFLFLATLATWWPDFRLMLMALLLSLPNAAYLLGGESWVQGMGLYIPACLLASVFLLWKGNSAVPRLLLLPVYAFYLYLAQALFGR